MRFFAVTLVLISHWLAGSFLSKIPTGSIGVTFFFVLSGFLITFNLFQLKEKREQGIISSKAVILNFFQRRALRIFPLYLFVVVAIYLLIPQIYEGNFLWFLLYVPNILIYVEGKWMDMMSHLWSLGVEEQFYLIWPFVMLFTPSRYILRVFMVSILFSIGFKFYFYSNGISNYVSLLPISCFDAFGVGAYLAYLKFRDLDKCWLREKFQISLIIGVILAFLTFYFDFNSLKGISISLLSFLLIIKGINRIKGFTGFIFDNALLQYLGKISYGLYMYHNLIPWLLRCMRGKESKFPIDIYISKMDWIQAPVVLLTIQFGMLVLLSAVSWHFFEKPINGLKRYLVVT